DELGELGQVLDSGGEVEFVASAARSAQPQSVELQDALEMREQHLDFLPLAARGLVRLGLGDVAGQVACAFMDRAQNLARRCIGAAARLQWAWPAVVRAGPVTDQIVIWHTGPWRRKPSAVVLEGFPGRATVSVTGVIVGELVAREGSVGALGFVEHW